MHDFRFLKDVKVNLSSGFIVVEVGVNTEDEHQHMDACCYFIDHFVYCTLVSLRNEEPNGYRWTAFGLMLEFTMWNQVRFDLWLSFADERITNDIGGCTQGSGVAHASLGFRSGRKRGEST